MTVLASYLITSRCRKLGWHGMGCGLNKLSGRRLRYLVGRSIPRLRLYVSTSDQSRSEARRFPPPWTVEGHNDACFIVKDRSGYAISYVSSLCVAPRFEPGQASFA